MPLGPRRRLAALAVVAATAVVVSACRPSTVQLAFVPRPGAVYRYAIHVVSTSTTRLADQAPVTRVDEADLDAVDTVVAVTPSGTQLRVTLSAHGGPPLRRDYDVTLDREAALVGIAQLSGAQPAVPAGLELAELVPADLGAPPGRPLHAGDRWSIDQPVALPRLVPTRVVGSGRLDSFGIVHHRKVAVTSAQETIELTPSLGGDSPPAVGGSTPPAVGGSSAPAAGDPVALEGQESTVTSVTRSLSDGAIEESTAESRGDFAILLDTTTQRMLGTGNLTLDVRSSTRRVN